MGTDKVLDIVNGCRTIGNEAQRAGDPETAAWWHNRADDIALRAGRGEMLVDQVDGIVRRNADPVPPNVDQVARLALDWIDDLTENMTADDRAEAHRLIRAQL